MREFKKYFFESLIQLTILASVFRQNSDVSLNHTTNQFVDQLNNNYLPSSYNNLARNNSLVGELDLLLLNENSNYYRYQTNVNNSNSSAGFDHIHRTHLAKDQANLNDLKFIQRFNRLLSASSSSSSSDRYIKPINPITNQQLFPNNLFVAPATFQNNNEYPKELQFDLTEAQNRLLLDLNANTLNSFSKEEIFEMEVDIQKMIERDIDLGITEEAYQQFDPMTTDYFDPNDGLTWKKGGQDLAKTLLERQKDTDLLSLTNIFEQQFIPDGFKLIVEEDTGEWILSVLPEDNSTHYEPTASPQVEPVNKTASPQYVNMTSSPKPLRKLVNRSKSMEDEDVETHGDNNLFNIKVKYSIFSTDDDEVRRLLFKEIEEANARDAAIRQQNLSRHSTDELVNFNPVYSQSPEAGPVSNEIQPLQLSPELLRQTSVDTELLKMFENSSVLNDLNQNEFVSFNQTKPQEPVAVDLNTNFMPAQTSFGYINAPVTNVSSQPVNSSFMGYQTQYQENSLSGLKANVSLQPANETFNLEFLNSFDYSMQNMPSPISDPSSSDQSNSSIDFNLDALDAYFDQAIMMNKQANLTSQEARQISSELAQSHDGFDINEIFKMIEETTSNLNTSSVNVHNSSAFPSNSAPSSSLTTSVKHDSAKSDQSITLKQEASEIEDEAMPFNVAYNRSTILRGFEHNHTYLFGSQSQDENDSENFRILHPYSYKNKLKKMNGTRSNATQQASRDELLLRENRVHISLDQIVNTDADQFNELVKVHALTPEQLSIVKDIRRRGKNKVAAQICRKRKIDSIDTLREDVDELREEKRLLQNEHLAIEAQIKKMAMKFDELYKDMMGNEYDKNDPIMICMTNLKDQLNLGNNAAAAASTLNDSANDDEDELDDYDDSEEEEEEDDLEEDDDSNGSLYPEHGVQLMSAFIPEAHVTTKKPLAKAMSSNRKYSKVASSMLSPPTTDLSNSSLSDEQTNSQLAKAKRLKKN